MDNVVCIQARRQRRLEAALVKAGLTLLPDGGVRLAFGASMADVLLASQWNRSMLTAADGKKSNAEQ